MRKKSANPLCPHGELEIDCTQCYSDFADSPPTPTNLVFELVEALTLVLDETGRECYCDRPNDYYPCGRCRAKTAIDKATGVKS